MLGSEASIDNASKREIFHAYMIVNKIISETQKLLFLLSIVNPANEILKQNVYMDHLNVLHGHLISLFPNRLLAVSFETNANNLGRVDRLQRPSVEREKNAKLKAFQG